MIKVAYCCDKNAEQGLYASINSVIKNTTLKTFFYIITNPANPINSKLIAQILNKTGHGYAVEIVNTNSFKSFRLLVGSSFPYAKLLIPEIIKESRVIYLDADTIVDLDLAELWQMETQAAPLAAVRTYPVENSIEKEFLISVGLRPTDSYFNTGVMIMDLDLLREINFSESTLKFARSYRNSLRTADQTVINALFSSSIMDLPNRFNNQVAPTANMSNLIRNESIFHLSARQNLGISLLTRR